MLRSTKDKLDLSIITQKSRVRQVFSHCQVAPPRLRSHSLARVNPALNMMGGNGNTCSLATLQRRNDNFPKPTTYPPSLTPLAQQLQTQVTNRARMSVCMHVCVSVLHKASRSLHKLISSSPISRHWPEASFECTRLAWLWLGFGEGDER